MEVVMVLPGDGARQVRSLSQEVTKAFFRLFLFGFEALRSCDLGITVVQSSSRALFMNGESTLWFPIVFFLLSEPSHLYV